MTAPDNTARRELLGALAVLVALTIVVTWPQAWYLGTKVPNHDDPFLSMWRLSWIAQALRADIRHLNIFSPHTRTLAFSDATLLEGVLGAPWLSAHANVVLVYNVLLLTGIVSSGLGMFVRSLTSLKTRLSWPPRLSRWPLIGSHTSCISSSSGPSGCR